MRPLPEPLQRAPFTTATAREVGVRPGTLRGPAVERLFVGAYRVSGGELDLPDLVQAALLVAPPDALVTGVTALRLRGVAVGPVRPVHLVSAHPHPVRRPGLHVTRVAVLPAAARRVVSPEVAFVVAASALDLVELVAAGDHLVRRGLATPHALFSPEWTALFDPSVRAARTARAFEDL